MQDNKLSLSIAIYIHVVAILKYCMYENRPPKTPRDYATWRNLTFHVHRQRESECAVGAGLNWTQIQSLRNVTSLLIQWT